MERLAVFASGTGSNCENLIRYFAASGKARVALVVSNRADAKVVECAERLGVETIVITKAQLGDADYMLPMLREHNISMIILAGFLPIIPQFIIDEYPRRIINIHPSLLPKYGGKGMWGHHVHEAVKASGDKITGITVHYVSAVCDGGDVIAQRTVDITPDDDVDDIARKVHQLEMEFFPKIIEDIINK